MEIQPADYYTSRSLNTVSFNHLDDILEPYTITKYDFKHILIREIQNIQEKITSTLLLLRSSSSTLYTR